MGFHAFRVSRHPPPWLGFGEWILQANVPHKTCPSKFASPTQQGQNLKANSEDESEAVFNCDFDNESSTELES